MNGADALAALLERVSAARGEAAMFSERELAEWPPVGVTAFKAAGLLAKGPPATVVSCPGCEQNCAMTVEVVTTVSGKPRAFVLCDQRDDVARVDIANDLLEQWASSPERVADTLAKLLGTRRSGGDPASRRWNVGLLRGAKQRAHVVLTISDVLQISVAGHSVPVSDVLEAGDDGLLVDRRALVRCVDTPVPGAGDKESTEERRKRVRARLTELKASGERAFLQVLAVEEDVSVSRIKQLLKEEPAPAANWMGPILRKPKTGD